MRLLGTLVLLRAAIRAADAVPELKTSGDTGWHWSWTRTLDSKLGTRSANSHRRRWNWNRFNSSSPGTRCSSHASRRHSRLWHRHKVWPELAATHGARLWLRAAAGEGPSPRRLRSPGGDTRRRDLQEASNTRKVSGAREERPGRGCCPASQRPGGGR